MPSLVSFQVHPKIMQERFGHSSVAITMDIYSHLMPNMQSDAVALVRGVPSGDRQAGLERERLWQL